MTVLLNNVCIAGAGTWISNYCIKNSQGRQVINQSINSVQFVRKWILISGNQFFLSKPPLADLSSISPCTHEEADTHMLLQRIMIQTVDTDFVVLAVAAAQGLKPADELWLAFGT